MKQRLHYRLFVATCLLLISIIYLPSCSGKKDDYKGYVPVSRSETEVFANQVLSMYKQGDKTQLFNAGIDFDAMVAIGFFTGKDIPDMYKTAGAKEQAAFADQTKALNHMRFDSLKSMEFVEIKEIYGTFCVAFDCKYDQSIKNSISDRIMYFVLLKNKYNGEIHVAGIMENIL